MGAGATCGERISTQTDPVAVHMPLTPGGDSGTVTAGCCFLTYFHRPFPDAQPRHNEFLGEVKTLHQVSDKVCHG